MINSILEEFNIEYTGFRTIPYKINDIHMGYAFKSLVKGMEETPPISVKIKGMKPFKITETFDYFGTLTLEESLKSKEKVILLDEIGVFESESIRFQNLIRECLDSDKICFGVIKKKENSFLNEIKSRDDVLLIELPKIELGKHAKIREEVLKRWWDR
ncbi:nucleoside-triphosphatase [Clostridium chrysemydis]|uniref:nucleoside-triphosphatase n=1 Tax=Clostridium chrysemydis TaxID=2665504 RepID=UPI0018836E21|nr:nucleoside-triphosphatase [Clostridium chrysemydis]